MLQLLALVKYPQSVGCFCKLTVTGQGELLRFCYTNELTCAEMKCQYAQTTYSNTFNIQLSLFSSQYCSAVLQYFPICQCFSHNYYFPCTLSFAIEVLVNNPLMNNSAIIT